MTNLTKQEINLRIAELAFPNATISKCLQDESAIVGDALQYDRGRSFKFDYANWNDLMPLVVEHGVSLDKDFEADEWIAYHNVFNVIDVISKDPQMALALCLLKVLEAKEKDNEE